ncbi:MAG: hypothetical protein HXS54_16165 [Theionarchaea archaeon]|nr:hypothetical protein [Theionarchaea archaeon]
MDEALIYLRAALEIDRETGLWQGVLEVRVRWLSHHLHAEVNIAVNPGSSIEE